MYPLSLCYPAGVTRGQRFWLTPERTVGTHSSLEAISSIPSVSRVAFHYTVSRRRVIPRPTIKALSNIPPLRRASSLFLLSARRFSFPATRKFLQVPLFLYLQLITMSSSMACLNIEIPKKPANKTPSEHRRATKPIMEKRRRARINHSLNELKSLILDALHKDVS